PQSTFLLQRACSPFSDLMKDLLKRLWHRATGQRQVPPPPQDLPRSQVAKKTRVEPPRIIRGERTLIVGVDFGTSSTKVIWQDLSDNKFEVLAWFPGEMGLGAFLFPSVIDINNSEIRYGHTYDEKKKNQCRLTSIKLCVLCRNNPQICSCGNSIVQKGMVHLPGSNAAYPAT